MAWLLTMNSSLDESATARCRARQPRYSTACVPVGQREHERGPSHGHDLTDSEFDDDWRRGERYHGRGPPTCRRHRCWRRTPSADRGSPGRTITRFLSPTGETDMPYDGCRASGVCHASRPVPASKADIIPVMPRVVQPAIVKERVALVLTPMSSRQNGRARMVRDSCVPPLGAGVGVERRHHLGRVTPREEITTVSATMIGVA